MRDASDPGLNGGYDLITMFDPLHHLARRVEALMRRRSAAPLVSVIHCLPRAMAEQPSAAPGAVVAPETVLALAAEVGFEHAEVAPIEHDMMRFFVAR